MRRSTPSHEAPDENALKPRMIHSPIFQCRPSAICHGMAFAGGIGNAAVLSTTRRLTCAVRQRPAEADHAAPVVHGQRHRRGIVYAGVRSSACRSSMRDCRV
jgi:hypothetical protein